MYVVKKPLNIGGKRRVIGEILKDEEITNAAIIRSGMVAKIDSGLLDAAGSGNSSLHPSEEDGNIFVPVSGKNHADSIFLTPKEVFLVFWVLQISGSDKAVTEVKECSSRNVLSVVAQIDGRKAVRSAALAKLEELRAVETKTLEVMENDAAEGDA